MNLGFLGEELWEFRDFWVSNFGNFQVFRILGISRLGILTIWGILGMMGISGISESGFWDFWDVGVENFEIFRIFGPGILRIFGAAPPPPRWAAPGAAPGDEGGAGAESSDPKTGAAQGGAELGERERNTKWGQEMDLGGREIYGTGTCGAGVGTGNLWGREISGGGMGSESMGQGMCGVGNVGGKKGASLWGRESMGQGMGSMCEAEMGSV